MITGKKAPKEKLTKDQAKKKSVSKITVTTTSTSAPLIKVTRASLMAEAKAKGVKYFRILTRDELQKVLDPNTEAAVAQETIDKAKARWKAGWGTRKAQVANADA